MKNFYKFILITFLISSCKDEGVLYFKLQQLEITTEYYTNPLNPPYSYQCPKITNYLGKIRSGGSTDISSVCFLTNDSLFILSGGLSIQPDGKINSYNIYVIKNLAPNLKCKKLDTTSFYGEIQGKIIKKNTKVPYMFLELYIDGKFYSGLTIKAIKP
jgi:hypothetical protein